MRPEIDVHPDRQTVIELVWRPLRFPKASTPSRRTMAWASCALPCRKIELELDLSTDSGTEGSTSTPPASPFYVSVVFGIRSWLLRERGAGRILCGEGEISKVGLCLRLGRTMVRPFDYLWRENYNSRP